MQAIIRGAGRAGGRLRIAALHGLYQNGDAFRAKVMPLIQDLEPVAEFGR